MSDPDLDKLLADEAAKVAAMTVEERRAYYDQIKAGQLAYTKANPYTGGERQARAIRPEYRYIGKDGMPILARDLEDQRDAALAKLEQIEEAWSMALYWPFWFVADKQQGGLNVTNKLLKKFCEAFYEANKGEVLISKKDAAWLADKGNEA